MIRLEDITAARGRSVGGAGDAAVMDRPSSRRLLFDDRGLLGRVDDVKGVRREARPPVGAVVERGFCGVHVIDPSLLDRLTESGVFSILDPYLRLAGAGAILRPFSADGCRWIDVGRPADLLRANASPLPPP